MSNANKAGLINTVLLTLVALLGGGIAGYLVGQSQAPRAVATNPVQVATPLNDIISVQDVWIVDGFSCPTPGCTNPLLTCTHPLARQIRDWVNKQRGMGRDGQSIRAEIIQVNGANLNNLPPDTL
jgi:hypothetical protein